jgi:hypothetical protein
MKQQFENKASQEDVKSKLELVQKPAFFMSSLTSGVCLFGVLAGVMYGLFPDLQNWGFGDFWQWGALAANALVLVAALYVGWLIDFNIIKTFGKHTFTEGVALASGRFHFPIIRLITLLMVGLIALGAAYFSFATSKTGSAMIANLGTNRVEVDKGLRADYELAVKDQKAELSQFDKEFEDAKFEADERKQQALAAAKNSTYFARISEGEYFKSKYDKLVNAANDQYQKDLKAAKASTDAKKAEYQKLSGGLVESKKAALETASGAALSKVDATTRIITNLGVWPLLLGIFIMGISACFEVYTQLDKAARNSPKQPEPARNNRNSEPETTRNSPQRFSEDFDTGNVFRRQNL